MLETLFTGEDTSDGRAASTSHASAFRGGTFCATYADGVADIDLGEELPVFHGRARRAGDDGGRAAGAAVRRGPSSTVTGRVKGVFVKPRSEHWINGGFFVFEPGVLDYLYADLRPGARAAQGPSRDGRLLRLSPLGILGVHGHTGRTP